MKPILTSLGITIAAVLAVAPLHAAPVESCGIATAAGAGSVIQPDPRTTDTRHQFAAGGKRFDYAAKAGTMLIHDDDGHPVAEIGYTAYSRSTAKGAAPRPVIFAFNGGPGSSSAWLHVGLLGPKRLIANDAAPTSPSEMKVVDNVFGMIDKADVVLIDPVGTGIARAVCGKKDQDFWNTDADADSVSRFIMQYLGENGLWAAPKYILGESYGTIRAAVVLNYLRTRRVSFDGAILLGIATDIETIYTELPGNDRPYPLFVAGFAATAWYHKLVPESSGPLEPFLAEARRFALGPYASALLQGNALPDAERDAIAEQVHRFTGLSTDYVKAANLRVSEFAYGQEILRDQRKVVSRLDSRFVGDAQDPLQKSADYDPLLAYLGSALNAAFNDYYRRGLNVSTDRVYQMLNSDAGNRFTMDHKPIGAPGDRQPIANAGVDLATVMTQDPNLRILVLAGYFDLGSPFTAAEYMVNHLAIAKPIQARVSIKYYRSGHMIYVHEPSLRQLKSDLDQFVDAGHRTAR
ncbi:MAG: peptidase S10 [Candidatus Sphingomonas phytovorans]|nr:peptidase S10 [Sphingomonas sp.]WEK00222.1 MAG: peptidase S10 [Sphingomonas sp.]